MKKRRLVVEIDKERCTECGKCKKCPKINRPKFCSGCGKCVAVCSIGAIRLVERTTENKINNNKTTKTMKAQGFKFTILLLLAAGGFSIVVMWLWNALLPDIFGITTINFWQALGLFALARILFGGVGDGIMKHAHHHHHSSIKEQWMKMTPEQRKKFIDRRKHFGFGQAFAKYHFDMHEHEEAVKEND